MIRLACLLFCLVSLQANASGVTLRFDDVPLAQLTKIVLGDVLQRAYVLDAALPSSSVSVVMPDASPAAIEREFAAVLKRVGFGLDCSQKVCRVLPSLSDPREVAFYRPKFRNVAYLLTSLQPWFPVDAFSGGRNGTVQTQPTGGASQSLPTIQQSNGAIASTAVTSDVLAFRGSSDDVARFRAMVAGLDVAEAQVMVTAMVYEVQSSDRKASAWDIVASIAKQRLGVSFRPGEVGSSGFSISLGDSSAFFSALSSDSRFKVLASPRVRVVSGQKARFSVGDEVPVLGAVVVDNGASTQSVSYKQSGVILDLTAHVFGDVTRLSVHQQISQFARTQTGVANSPTLTKRELQTELVAGPGDVVVLGGLDQNKESQASSWLSFFSKARADTSDSETTQVLVFLKLDRI